MSDWKGALVDNLQIYWWKHFSFTHNKLSTYVSEILHNSETSPECYYYYYYYYYHHYYHYYYHIVRHFWVTPKIRDKLAD